MSLSAQHQGMLNLGSHVRALIPPRLEAVVIVYNPEDPTGISSVMAPVGNAVAGAQQLAALERGRIACKTFAEKPPSAPGFAPQS